MSDIAFAVLAIATELLPTILFTIVISILLIRLGFRSLENETKV